LRRGDDGQDEPDAAANADGDRLFQGFAEIFPGYKQQLIAWKWQRMVTLSPLDKRTWLQFRRHFRLISRTGIHANKAN
jgi:hypothetical protein